MKRILMIVASLVMLLVFTSTISTITTRANRTPGSVTSLSPTVINASADTIVWVIENVLGSSLFGHFYASGDSTGITLNVKGSNFNGNEDKWVNLATYSFAGATADTTYFTPTTTGTYKTYRFQLTAGDTTTVEARVKIN